MKSSYIWFWYLCSRELWTDVLWNDVLSWMAAEVVFKCKAMSSVPCGPRWDIARLFFYFILEFFFLGMQVLEWNGIPLTSKTYEEVQSIISQQNGEAEICVRLWVFPHLFVSIFLAIHGSFNLKLLRWNLCQSERLLVIRK